MLIQTMALSVLLAALEVRFVQPDNRVVPLGGNFGVFIQLGAGEEEVRALRPDRAIFDRTLEIIRAPLDTRSLPEAVPPDETGVRKDQVRAVAERIATEHQTTHARRSTA